MNSLSGKAPSSREKRLDTLSAYLNEATALLEVFRSDEVDQRIRTFSQATPDDLFVALEALADIRGAVTVIHGPRGCAASRLRPVLRRGGSGNGEGRFVVTNLTQRETILGADGKLRAAIAAVCRRHRPQVVFVVATPTVAINNDDILSVVNELSEELGTPIVPVFSSGFASKAAIQGSDQVSHSLAKRLIPPFTGPRGEHANLLSIDEPAADRREGERLLAALGLQVNSFPSGAGPDALARAAAARLSVSLNFDTAGYLGEALQRRADVPFLPLPRPIGLQATRHWLEAVGAATGRQDLARQLHGREAVILSPLLEKTPLRGTRVYLSLDPATALAVVDLVRELGGDVAGLSVDHLDRLHLAGLGSLLERIPALQVHVGHGQGFEELNLLRRLKPDLYVGAGGPLVQVARLGIPAVSLAGEPIVGYRGMASFARKAVNALRNQRYVAGLAGGGHPYAAAWFQRSPDWHIKQEVR